MTKICCLQHLITGYAMLKVSLLRKSELPRLHRATQFQHYRSLLVLVMNEQAFKLAMQFC